MSDPKDVPPLEPKKLPIPATPLIEEQEKLLDDRKKGDSPGVTQRCRSCGRAHRAYNSDCTICAPPYKSRHKSRRSVRNRPPVTSNLVPPWFRGIQMRPMTSTEAIEILGDVACALAGKYISAHQARVMILAVRVQARILLEQETRLHQDRYLRETRRLAHQARFITIRRKAAAKIAVEARKQKYRLERDAKQAALAKKKNERPAPPPLELSENDRKLAQDP